MPEKKAKNATFIGIIVNIFLFGIKLVAAIMSGSLAVLSDALNSFTDIVTSIAIFIAVKVSHKHADQGHPFGHHRAEPIAGLVVAIMAGILGFEVLKRAVMNMINKTETAPYVNSIVIIILVTSIFVKLFVTLYFRSIARSTNSPAGTASYVDYRSEIVVSSCVLAGVMYSARLQFLDTIIAAHISLYILYSGYTIGMQNIEYLMGSSPDKETVREIGEIALAVEGVKGVNTIHAH